MEKEGFPTGVDSPPLPRPVGMRGAAFGPVPGPVQSTERAPRTLRAHLAGSSHTVSPC